VETTAPGRYRWAVLAAGTAAQASFSAFTIGLPVLAPALRTEFGLSLTQVGVVFAAQWVGTAVTLLPWGLLADRSGERLVLASGLTICSALLVALAFVSSFGGLIALLALAGGAGASVNSASGRAVMNWFAPEERGLALGVRQTAIPLGGVTTSLVLPHLGLEAAFFFLAAISLAGAAAGGLLIRERVREGVEPEDVPWTLRDGRLWRLSFGTGLYLVTQVALTGFVVLFLHDARHLSDAAAAGVLAGIQVLAVGTRIGAGRWSDLLGTRIVPLRRIGVTVFATVTLGAVLLSAPLALLAPVLVVAGGLAMSWNGLSLTAAAELAGETRSGAAIGFQQTALSIVGVGTPIAFGAFVAATSWRAGFAFAALFPLAGVVALRGLRV
jgi:sugar phosphate permease